MVTGLDRGSAPRQPAWSAWIFTWNKIVNLRHAARDTLLFYTEHRCWHIRLCPVRAKLPAPANDSGFRTVETISVHGEGFTLHDDKHNSYSRIQSKSGTKYQVNFAMRCRLQQEFTGYHETQSWKDWDAPGLSKAGKRQRLEEKKTKAAAQKTKSKFTVDELLDKAEECMDSYNFAVAQKFCQRALELEPDNLRALEVSGSLLLELGEGDKAKQCFGRAVELSPDEGFTKYMCLGQLLEGEEAVTCYNRGIQVMVAQRHKQQEQLEGAAACDPDSQTVTSQDISSAYCSIAEIYLTDSCFEDSAEEKCKESLEKAIEECDTNPEAHLLMASFQLSKDNREEAKLAIEKSLSLWLPERSDAEDEGEMEENVPEDPPLPYEQRIATAKILIELELMESAEKVLAGLLLEDDEIVQVWYLLGWLHYVQGEDHKAQARDNLQHALKIYPTVGCDDEDMLEHIKELLSELGPGEEEEEEEEEEMGEEQEDFTFDDDDEEDEDRNTEDAMDH